MKILNYFILTAFLALLCSCGPKPEPADKNATKETVSLFRSLYKLQKEGVMYGHQDDLMYGRTWWYEKERSDTKDFTGDYPAVAGLNWGTSNWEMNEASIQ